MQTQKKDPKVLDITECYVHNELDTAQFFFSFHLPVHFVGS